MPNQNTRRHIQQLCCMLLLWTNVVVNGDAPFNNRRPFAVVHPVEDHTKLTLDPEGLDLLRNLKGPVAPVVIIGPYRSGKSFTLNQLLGVPCDEGFGVGHQRQTQTKGIWMWGEPLPVTTADGTVVNMLLFDTEGFESTGKADVYDDRIFALSALISSILIYNLPESIREGDLEKLSFAVELAKAFYTGNGNNGSNSSNKKRELLALSRSQHIHHSRHNAHQQQQQLHNSHTLNNIDLGATDDSNNDIDIDDNIHIDSNTAPASVEPGVMIWLIQRDFLEGSSLQATLKAALQPVPNPHSDAGIMQLNRIRTSLTAIAGNALAAGLPQPHLNRTHLCEMGDAAFAPAYIKRREELKTMIRSTVKAKVVGGQALEGPGLAELITRVVTALNEREIPTAGSLVEYFNKDLVSSCRELYVKVLEEQRLPVDDGGVKTQAVAAWTAARRKFDKERFGGSTTELLAGLRAAVSKELEARKKANAYESSRVCEQAEERCETVLEKEAAQRLPSFGRFTARFDECKEEFVSECVGPSEQHYLERLEKAWERENTRFLKEYNERLLNGMVVLSIAAILFFRFVIRVNLGESLGWAAFVFLQVYPKTFVGEASMFDSGWWQLLVQAWEALVWNPVVDLGRWGWLIGPGSIVGVLTRRRILGWCWKLCCCLRKRRRRRKQTETRDLDV